MSYSLNNKLIVEAYKSDRNLKSTTSNGFSMVSQKIMVKGLKLLMEAKLNDGTVLPYHSLVYIKEELLYTAPWAQKSFKSDVFEEEFIVVDLCNVEFFSGVLKE